jgi:lipid-A-disaccharide synthase
MECNFVGHPVTTELAVTPDEIEAFAAKHGLARGLQTMIILPGSRKSEVERLSETFLAAFAATDMPDKQVIIPTLPNLRDHIEKVFAPILGGGLGVIVDGGGMSADAAARERFVAMAFADVALAASGTVSLELAAARTPMVIAYDMNWLSWQIISRMFLTDTVTLVNLVSETRVVPEFLGPNCKPDAIGAALGHVVTHPQDQLAALDTTMQRLGRGGDAPGLRAARAVLARL